MNGHNGENMNPVLDCYIKQCKLYPPSEIFYAKYGKEAKAEPRIQEICEALYKFSFKPDEQNTIGDLTSAYRDFEVLMKMDISFCKPEYIEKIRDNLIQELKTAVKSFDILFKKDQILQQYYSTWKLKSSVLTDIVWNLSKEKLNNNVLQ